MNALRIAEIRPVVVGNPWKNWVFVVVETDEGLVGLGEATLGVSTLPAVGALDDLRPVLIGEDPLRVERLWDRMAEAWYLPSDPVHLAAMSAIEIACWDILGKHLGAPLHQLFGGARRTRVPLYVNGWYRGERDPETFAALARDAVAAGFRGLKCDPFGTARRAISSAELRRSVALVAAVREAVGPDVALMVEAHDRFDVPTAVRVARALADLDIAWLEAPVPSEDVAALGEVARQSPVPVAAGERLTQLHQFRALGEAGPVRIWQPETLGVGGTRGVRAIAALAEAYGATLAPHNARGPVCSAVNLHLAATLDQISVLETFIPDDERLAQRVTRGLPDPVDGTLALPEGPGHGVVLDEEAAAAHPRDPGNVLRLFKPGWEKRKGETTR